MFLDIGKMGSCNDKEILNSNLKSMKVKKIETRSNIEYFVELENPYKDILSDSGNGFGGLNSEKKRAKKRTFDELSSLEKSFSIRKKEKYYKSVRWHIKRLIDCNYDSQSVFLTLTFKENLQDVEKANIEFNKFIKRLKYYRQKQGNKEPLKYVAVWERQKRGAVHYHLVIFNLEFINASELQKIWGNGFIKINLIKGKVSSDKIGLYISKYFAKDFEAKDNLKKAFFTSRNLKKPNVEELEITEKELEKIVSIADFTKEFEKCYYIVNTDTFTDKVGKFLYVVINKSAEKNQLLN